MVTIYDIAEATGYSAPTVSKALNGLGSLSEETRQRIINKAKELGYEPNISARTLTTKKSYLIGVVYDDTGMNKGFSHPLFSPVLNRFREKIEAAGYDIIFLSRHFNMTYFSHANFRCIDGVIIINPATNNASDFDDFIRTNLPRVSTNTIFKDICTVITANEQGGYAAAEYFINHGHKKIAYISAPVDGISAAPTERYEGFKSALKTYNLYDEELYELSATWDKESAYEAFGRLIKRRKDITAVFVTNDQLAFGVCDYAKDHNIKIPEDISVIGFDDDFAAEYAGLTTFRQSANEIAEISAQMMLDQIDGKTVPSIIRCRPELIERNSVKTIRGFRLF
ncbi:LacI family DNA-binding transcriptional regulator [Treponema bryantii]|uniref:LacI family DNA-binding transcriptional regulator n=1 Tax=Treponema bryantii TaxID=163 RepID=UPI002B320E21|nr:putative HTH-type transcriptional repressor ExuR [Treponema bryantii]